MMSCLNRHIHVVCTEALDLALGPNTPSTVDFIPLVRRLEGKKKRLNLQTKMECYINLLPVELLLRIFSFLSHVELHGQVRRVSEQFKDLAEDHSLWRHVDMTQCNLTMDQVMQILKDYMVKIETLILGGALSLDQGIVVHWQHITMLKTSCPNLQQLTIQHSMIHQAVFDVLPLSLRSLTVDSCRSFDRLPKPSKSQTNPFRRPNLTQVFVRKTEWLKLNYTKFPNIKSLTYSHASNVGYLLVGVGNLTNLQDLNVSTKTADTTPQSDSADYYPFVLSMKSKLKELHRLSTLNISGRVDVNDALVEDIFKSIPNLEELHLAGCTELTDEVFAHIGSAKNLQLINVKDCPKISEPAKEEIKKYHRKCVL